MTDLLELMLGKEFALTPAERKSMARKGPKAAGYAAMPGTGPAGETCRSCKHLYRRVCSKTYLKCSLVRGAWTAGKGSDVLARSPACRRWEPLESAPAS